MIDGIIEATIFFLDLDLHEVDIVTMSFEIIHNIATQFQKIQIQCGANQAIEFFNARGLENVLNKLQLSSNDKVQEHAIRVYELYYL